MDINAEKQEIIKRLDQLTDPSAIRAIRYLVDLSLSSQPQASQPPAASISDHTVPHSPN
jgi:hypothetical protein